MYLSACETYHGWARAHPAPAVLGHGIRADPKIFFGGGVGGRWRTDSATNLRRKAFYNCKLSVYIWLLEASPPDPPGFCPWTSLGDFRPPDTSVPQIPCEHPDFRTWLRHSKLGFCRLLPALRAHLPSHDITQLSEECALSEKKKKKKKISIGITDVKDWQNSAAVGRGNVTSL